MKPNNCKECRFYFNCRTGSIANAYGGLECSMILGKQPEENRVVIDHSDPVIISPDGKWKIDKNGRNRIEQSENEKQQSTNDETRKAYQKVYGMVATTHYMNGLNKAQAEIEELKDGYISYRKAYCEAEIERIKLKQQIEDTENALTGAIDCINDMKCCGNCDNEDWFHGENNCVWYGKCKNENKKAGESHWTMTKTTDN